MSDKDKAVAYLTVLIEEIQAGRAVVTDCELVLEDANNDALPTNLVLKFQKVVEKEDQ